MRGRNKNGLSFMETQLLQRIEKLEGVIKVIERDVWILKNPPKFERGEVAEIIHRDSYGGPTSRRRVEILDSKMPHWNNYWWTRMCQIREVNGKLGEVEEIEEGYLTKIEKTVRAKS